VTPWAFIVKIKTFQKHFRQWRKVKEPVRERREYPNPIIDVHELDAWDFLTSSNIVGSKLSAYQLERGPYLWRVDVAHKSVLRIAHSCPWFLYHADPLITPVPGLCRSSKSVDYFDPTFCRSSCHQPIVRLLKNSTADLDTVRGPDLSYLYITGFVASLARQAYFNHQNLMNISTRNWQICGANSVATSSNVRRLKNSTAYLDTVTGPDLWYLYIAGFVVSLARRAYVNHQNLMNISTRNWQICGANSVATSSNVRRLKNSTAYLDTVRRVLRFRCGFFKRSAILELSGGRAKPKFAEMV